MFGGDDRADIVEDLESEITYFVVGLEIREGWCCLLIFEVIDNAIF